MLELDESMQLGEPRLDEDHRQLLRIARRALELDACDVRSETVSEVLSGFVDYAYRHFDAEETWLREIGYPEADAHALLHEALVERAAQICMDVMHARPAAVGELRDLICKLFLDHLDTEDRKVAAFATARRAGAP